MLFKETGIILEAEKLKNRISRIGMKSMHVNPSVFPQEHSLFKNEMIVNYFCNVVVKKNRAHTGEDYGPITATG